MRRAFAAAVLCCVCMLTHAAESTKLRGELARQLAYADETEMLPVVIVLSDQLDATLAERWGEAPGGRERIRANLVTTATESQRSLLNGLSRLGPQPVTNVRTTWLVNAISLTTTPAVIRHLASDDAVGTIALDEAYPAFIGYDEFTLADLPTFPSDPRPKPDPNASWGVISSGAAAVWDRLDITGRGVVVAVVDSGVCYRHPDVAQRIWINPGENLDGDDEVMDADDLNGVDDDGNGFVDDLIGWDFASDDNDPDGFAHGSHVTGTIAGDGSSGFRAGVAPGVQIMPLLVGSRASQEMDAWEAIQYAVDNDADVLNLSMGWRHRWNPDRVVWRQLGRMAQAMGTTMIVASGNDARVDPPPDDVRTPGDVPEVITVGALNEYGLVAYFSSRGPSTWEDVEPFLDFPLPPGLIKPDIAAPGVDVVSHDLCEGQRPATGTSMATPHVSGVAALMLEADPTLGPQQIREILTSTAQDMGPPGPDNDSGAGRMDALAAVRKALRQQRFVSWRVDDFGGNRDRSLDLDETGRLFVTIANEDVAATGPMRARLIATGDAIEVVSPTDTYVSIGPGQRSESQRGFTIRVRGECAERETFVLELERTDGSMARLRFDVRIGATQPRELLVDDAESDRGWETITSADVGEWTRVDPLGTVRFGRLANPDEDASEPGRHAFVTGNGAAAALQDDLDGGEVMLVSPALDASRFETLVVEWSEWFYREGRTSLPPNEFLALEVSDDAGESWVTANLRWEPTGDWARAEASIGELVSLDSPILVRFRAADIGHDQLGGTLDSLVEAGIDDIRIHGQELICD